MRSNPGSNYTWQPGPASLVLVRHKHRLLSSLCVVFILLASLLTAQKVFSQEVSVRAELSAPIITRDESVTLTITATGLDKELDPSALDRDFDVVGKSSSRQTSLTIGANNEAVNTSVVTWALELIPKGEGVFTVPAVKVGDYSTQLLSLTVNAVPSGAQRDVYIETSVDTSEPWVQSQVVMSVRVYEGVTILDGSLNNPEASDLQVERLGDDSVSQQTIDGREYRVTERRFALFPQRSGALTIEPVTLSVTVPVQSNQSRGFFAPSRRLTRRSDAITLNVQARPSGGTAWWLPARSLVLADEWQGNTEAAEVGQPLTRTLIVRAEGVLNSQLPEITIPAVDGMSVYAEEPRLAMASTAQGLIAEQRINWALIPERSGTLSMPAVRIDWFDIATGQTQTSTLPEQSITVLAAGAGAQDPTDAFTAAPAPPASQSLSTSSLQSLGDNAALTPPDETAVSLSDTDVREFSTDVTDMSSGLGLPASSQQQISVLQQTVNSWQRLAYVAVALCVLILLAVCLFYLRFKRAEQLSMDSANAESDAPLRVSAGSSGSGRLVQNLVGYVAPMGPLGKLCKQGNFQSIKAALLAWSAHHWPHDAPDTLDKLQMRLPEGAARDKIGRLQAALYGKTSDADSVIVLASDLEDLAVDLKTVLGQGGESGATDPLHNGAGDNGHAGVAGGKNGRGGKSYLPDL